MFPWSKKLRETADAPTPGAHSFHTGGVINKPPPEPPKPEPASKVTEADILALNHERKGVWQERYSKARAAAVDAAAKPEEPVMLQQDSETGMWSVCRPVLSVSPREYGHIPEIIRYRSQLDRQHMHDIWATLPRSSAGKKAEPKLPDEYPEPPETVEVQAKYEWVRYEPIFVHMAEALGWAQETVLMGRSPIKLDKEGMLAPGAGAELIEQLAKAREERNLIQQGVAERQATYADEAMF